MSLRSRLRVAWRAFRGDTVLQGRISIHAGKLQSERTIHLAHGATVSGCDIALDGVATVDGDSTSTIRDSHIVHRGA